MIFLRHLQTWNSIEHQTCTTVHAIQKLFSLNLDEKLTWQVKGRSSWQQVSIHPNLFCSSLKSFLPSTLPGSFGKSWCLVAYSTYGPPVHSQGGLTEGRAYSVKGRSALYQWFLYPAAFLWCTRVPWHLKCLLVSSGSILVYQSSFSTYV